MVVAWWWPVLRLAGSCMGLPNNGSKHSAAVHDGLGKVYMMCAPFLVFMLHGLACVLRLMAANLLCLI